VAEGSDTPILSQIATPPEYLRHGNRGTVTLLQQGVENAGIACIFFFAILAKPDLLANIHIVN
jgi:hypothetical protein